jgi:hypothetical protein
MTDHILIIHETMREAITVTDALKQMYPNHAELFVPAGIGHALCGISLDYAVWFYSPSKMPSESQRESAAIWRLSSVNTRFNSGGCGNITPQEFKELMEEYGRL